MAGEHTGNETLIHPVGLVAVLVLGIVLLFIRREYAVLPMLILACFIPSAQRLVLAGVDLTLLRLLVLLGWIRLIVWNEFKGFSWTRLDTMVVAWMVSGTTVYVVQYADLPSLVNRAGWMFDGLGMYFLFRCVLRSWTDLERVAWSFAIVSVPVAVAFLIEQFTGRNIFAVFGGVRAITWIREGRLRCQGAFSHAILAGCFWASVLPLILSLWWQQRQWLVGTAVAMGLTIIVACASSTPILVLGFVLVGMALYPLRCSLRAILWGGLLCLTMLHLVMQKPVWHLMARVSAVGGSTGWHRYRIMDATINNFGRWALLGEPDPMNWGVFEMRDITNQYILEGLRGGLMTLLLFIVMLATAFRMVGRAVRTYEGNKPPQLFAWCLGVALFAHVGAYFGVSYFGQIIMLVYLTLAMIGSLNNLALEEEQRLRSSVSTDPEVEPGDKGAINQHEPLHFGRA